MSDRKRATLVLFAAAFLLAPVPYLVLVVSGLVPLAWIFVAALQGIVVDLPKLTQESFFLVGLLLAHLLILGSGLYFAAWGVATLLVRLLTQRLAALAVAGLVAAGIFASTHDIYRVPGHHGAEPADLQTLVGKLAE